MPLSIGVLKETFAHEARVALTPDVAAKFLEQGVAVHMERGAGERSHFGDALFKGVQFHAEPAAVLSSAGVLLTVQPPTRAEAEALAPGALVVGFLQPHRELELVRALRDCRLTSFSVELDGYLARARRATSLPLAVGFGLKDRKDVDFVRGKAEIAIVGSESLRVLNESGVRATGDFIKTLVS